MNKNDFIGVVKGVDPSLTDKQAAKVVDIFTAAVTKALSEGESVSLVGFGTFDVKGRAERKARNPKTGEPITIAATKVPSFKAGKALKDAVK